MKRSHVVGSVSALIDADDAVRGRDVVALMGETAVDVTKPVVQEHVGDATPDDLDAQAEYWQAMAMGMRGA